MSVWRSLNGLLEMELVSAEPEKALSAINAKGIPLYQVRREKDLTLRFWVLRSDAKLLEKMSEKRGDSLRIVGKRGIYFPLLHLWKRKLLLTGIVVFIWSAVFLPTRVFFVQVEGNQTVPANRILSAAENSGIRFGASRREVRSERMKNALLDAVPQLQWAGVNTRGCRAIISVQERAQAAQEPETGTVSSIAASSDGYVLSTVVTRGTVQVQPGQAVKAGQILISGYTDCGIRIQATRAEGEIIAQTHRELQVVTPAEACFRRDYSGIKRRYSLLIGKKRIFFWKGSGIWDTSCGRIYREYYLTLPGGFCLPVALCVDTYTYEDTEVARISETEAAAALDSFARRYLTDQMIAGKICSSSQTVTSNGEIYCFRGSFVCTESIGRVKPEQIGETNGKTD